VTLVPIGPDIRGLLQLGLLSRYGVVFGCMKLASI